MDMTSFFCEKFNTCFDGVTIVTPSKTEEQRILSRVPEGKKLYKVKYADQMTKRFSDYLEKNEIKRKKLLFHGSAERNWASIIQNGLHAGKSGKFGGGIYLSPEYKMSQMYGKIIGVFDTAYGNPLFIYNYEDVGFNQNILYVNDKQCVHANPKNIKTLCYNEVVFFEPEAVILKYLIL